MFSRTQWQQWLAEHAQSHQSVRQFCDQRNLPENSFYRWRKVLNFQSPSPLANPLVSDSQFVQLGSERAAVLTSLIASCKNNEVEPWAYLKEVFTRLAYRPSPEELAKLLPDRWLSANPSHRWEIAQTRRDERKK